MAGITFLTGTMSSGKTTHLLQTHFNLESAFPGTVLLINRHDRMGDSVCSSRMGGVAVSVGVKADDSLISIIDNHNHENKTSIKFLFIDEAQFLGNTQVEDLVEIADIKDIEIFAYGLLTSYKGKLFSATARILEIADKIVQLDNNMRCWCGATASHNALFVEGAPAASGSDIVVDNSQLVEYQVMCRKHFTAHRNFQLQRS